MCIDLNFFKEIKSADLLAYFVLLLAYIGYAWSINRDLKSWKSLFISLRSDLKSQEAWIGGSGYSQETYKDKKSFSPKKIIFPLSFESLQEIIRRGPKEISNISTKFIDNLSLFNERIIAFNSALDNVKKIISFNPIMSEKLNERLKKLGMMETEEEVEFNFFKRTIRELKEKEDIFYLAENIRRLNRMIHVDLIGNRDNKDRLNNLYHEITDELDQILKNFDKRKPFFIRHRYSIMVMSLFLFFMIEIFLK